MTMSLYPSLDRLPPHAEIFRIKRDENTEHKINTESSLIVNESRTLQNNNSVDVSGSITHGLRHLVLCKDANKKIGFLTSSINNGIFVCFVLKNSSAAIGGLRFGDQILQINDTPVVGFSPEEVHCLVKNCSINNINFMIRDRPYGLTITMVKNEQGYFGFKFSNGRIIALLKNSSAARNGLLTDHNLIEIMGQNVIGMNSKEIIEIIDNAGPELTVTILPTFVFNKMLKKICGDYVRAKMDHSVHI